MSANAWMRLRESPHLVRAVIESQGPELATQTRLRQQFDAELVSLAFQLREARTKAIGKLDHADQLWADRLAVEQATSTDVARYKADRFARLASGQPISDLCCGLGSDAIAALEVDPERSVTAVDLREEALQFCRWNADAAGVSDRLKTRLADVTKESWSGLVHIDPDRRPNGHRVRRLEEVQPSLGFLQQLAAGEGGAIKLSPASNFGGKFPDAEIELISSGGECREATVWFGSLAVSESMRATVINGTDSTSIAGDPLDAIAIQSTLQEWLIDPDPAVVRSGLVDLLAEELGVARLDPEEEYLTGSAKPTGLLEPLTSAFVVLDRTSNNPKSIRRMLRSYEIGPLEVKTRHVAADANQLQKRYQQPEGRPGVLFLLREQQKTVAVLAQRPS